MFAVQIYMYNVYISLIYSIYKFLYKFFFRYLSLVSFCFNLIWFCFIVFHLVEFIMYTVLVVSMSLATQQK